MKPINLKTAVEKPESIPFSHYDETAKPDAQATRRSWAHPYLKKLLEQAGLPGNTKVALATINQEGFGLLNRIELELPDGQRMVVTPTQMNNRANRVRSSIILQREEERGKGKQKEVMIVDDTLVSEARWTTAWKAIRDHVNPPAQEVTPADDAQALAAAEAALAGSDDALKGVETPAEAQVEA